MDDMELWSQMIDQYGGRPVIGKIVVLSRSLAKEFQYDKQWACISIADAHLDQEHPAISMKNRKGLLTLRFDDIEFVRPGKKQIDSKQAEQIFDFVQEMWDDVELLMIHCNAGISRSSAIAKVISEFRQPDVTHIFDQLYQPNPIVQEVVRDRYTA